MIKSTFIFLFVSTFLISISINAQTVKVKIIETSDVHGAIFPYNFVNDKPSNNSLAQVHAYVESERAKEDQSVILVDNGDILQGDPAVYYYNYEKTNVPHLYAEVMNYMKYDAGTVGNHDVETGHPVYDKFNDEINFPWLAANAVDTKTGKPYFKPYHIIEKQGIKIAVLGLITPGIPNWLPKKIWEGIEFEDMIVTAKKWSAIIQEKEKPDLLVGLFHSGIDHTYDNQTADMPRNENASQLVAEQVPGFDIVFVGHDHLEWNKIVKGPAGEEVLILGPPSRARTVTVAEIDFTYNAENEKWDNTITGSIVEMKNIKPDEKFMNNFNSEFNEVKNYVSREIGTFTKTIDAKESIFSNSTFTDLIHNIQLEITNADISFTAPLSLYSKLDEGKIYVRDMFNLYRYENLLYTMELTGKEIKDYLEFSYSLWFDTMQSEDDNLLKFILDENGKPVISKRSGAATLKHRYYNFDSAEGIEYIVDVSKPAGKRISISSFSNGNEFSLDKKYKVAVNSYRGNGGGGHLESGAGIKKENLSDRVINSTEKDLRYYMMKWIEEKETVTPVETKNWKVVPEDWYQKAVKRDYDLMFNNKK
ncbi:MAG: bifunctional metallophosphatase/5'-nucleotidase [Ignavibacteriae bacterium]|nr:bifunctional metallophosphatase/5'-nucleotidase [Ignavibacteriota bacterium]NOG98501.1 bifunctional metallophosphatase/5'-nucleotidase [Ignavibacteriota bacterium]